MKLTLWQQFGSNHSSSFTVYGRFKTVADAEKAEEILQQLFRDILRWYQTTQSLWSETPTPPEIEFAQRYHLEWVLPVDWLDWRDSVLEAEASIHRIGPIVTVSNGDQTHLGKEPFKALLQKMGAKLTAGYDADSLGDYLVLNISARATDDEAARAIVEDYHGRFMADGIAPRRVGRDGLMIRLQNIEASGADEILAELKRYGCKNIRFGVQKRLI